MSSAKRRSDILPAEFAWLYSETNASHLSFFEFFMSYPRRMAIKRFKKVISFISNEQKRKKSLKDFNEWKRTNEAKKYWSNRKGTQNEDTISDDPANIRKNILNGLKFDPASQNVPMDIIIDLMNITNELNTEELTKFNAVKRIINTINDDTDPVTIKLLLC
ncbi:unnamed protein product [Mucor hiemalis]